MVDGEVEWTPIFDIGAFLWDRLYAFCCKWSFSINSAREALRSGPEKTNLTCEIISEVSQAGLYLINSEIILSYAKSSPLWDL